MNDVKKYQDLLEKVDTMAIDEVLIAQEEIKDDVKKMNDSKASNLKKQKPSEKKSINKSNLESKKVYKGISSFRYGAMNLYAELEINHEQEYTKTQLIDILQKHGYFEFTEKNTEFIQYDKDGTIVITIKGNSKGLEIKKLSRNLLNAIEARFKNVYLKNKTEARILIYTSDGNEVMMIVPEQKNTDVSTTSDIQFNITENNVDYYLTFDFHSHHKMGAFFSSQDDANEKFRNIIYGVFSWFDNKDTWKFRLFDGRRFVNLIKEEVIQE